MCYTFYFYPGSCFDSFLKKFTLLFFSLLLSLYFSAWFWFSLFEILYLVSLVYLLHSMIVDLFSPKFRVEGQFHASGLLSCGKWTPTDIDLDFISIEEDTVSLVYQRHFLKYRHFNSYIRDEELGPVVISIKIEKVFQKKDYHVLLRFIGGTIYRCLSSVAFPNRPTLEEIALTVEPRLKFNKLHAVFLPQAPQMINKFDQHCIHFNHKFGILFQRTGQTTEEEILGNCSATSEYQEFLSFLGDSVNLQSFRGFSGGLDTKNNLTGLTSIYTTFQGREIMFHVATLLPFDETDIQQIQRKRHIGNDIVAIIFQEENAVFVPGTFKSHFLKVLFVIQPAKDLLARTIYRLTVVVDQDCPTFNPLLPHPPVYLKNDQFRSFLFIKMINAEVSAYKSLHFASLNCRARGQLLENLIYELETCNQVEGYYGLNVSDRKHTFAIKRKLNYLFKTSVREEPLNHQGIFCLNPTSPSKNYLPEVHFDRKFSQDENIRRVIPFSTSESATKRYSTQVPIKWKESSVDYSKQLFSENQFSGSLTLDSNYRKNGNFYNEFNSSLSKKLYVSLDEKSFSEMILDTLETNNEFQRSNSQVSLRFLSSDSFEKNTLSLTHFEEQIPQNCESPLEVELSSHDKTIQDNQISTHFRCKSDQVSADPHIYKNTSDYSQLQSEIQKLVCEKSIMRKENLKLQGMITELREANDLLCRHNVKQSREINELNFDMRLFAYYQKKIT